MNHLERALDNKNQWWKYLIILLGVFLGKNIIGVIPLVVVLVVKTLQSPDMIIPTSDNMMNFSNYGIDPSLGLILAIFIPSAIGLITLVLLLKPLHKRKLTELINGTMNIRWRRFLFAIMIWSFLLFLYLIIDYYSNPNNFTINFNLFSLIPLVFISIFFIPVQTTFEEVLFRGYLTQGIGVWTKSRWIAIIIPTLLFSLIHSLNPEVKEYGFWLMMPQYFIFGLVLGLITILDDGIESSMGAHAANNIFASIFITSKSSVLQTHALLEQQSINPFKEIFILLVMSVIFIAILKRKYKWSFSVLNKKIAYEIS
jgi:membrane protease YdiL (CAAX protease family)